MRAHVTVDYAIKKGHVMVNVPVIITIIGCPGIALYLSKQHGMPNWSIGIAFLIGFVLAWLVWSFMITKWRIWAFENVRNVHELKKRAIQEKLIWNDGNIFEKTEIRTTEDQRKLKKLQKKFEQKDTYREDHSLPPKTEIYYSKTYKYLEFAVSILIIGVGIMFFTKGESLHLIIGSILVGLGLYSARKESRNLCNNAVQITLDSNGIETSQIGFKNWSTIHSEEVVTEGYGKSSRSYFIYFYNDDDSGFEKIEIEPLKITPKALDKLLKTYRIRHQKKQRTTTCIT